MIARTRRTGLAIGATIVVTLFGVLDAISARQTPIVQPADDRALREYTGVYQWGSNAFVYLQLWNEFTGFTKPSQLVAFDESGEVWRLYPTDDDRFVAGPGDAVPTAIESRVEFGTTDSVIESTKTVLLWSSTRAVGAVRWSPNRTSAVLT